MQQEKRRNFYLCDYVDVTADYYAMGNKPVGERQIP